jgi:biotin carboxyl carrier protein
MPYVATVGQQTYRTALEENAGQLIVSLDGRAWQLDLETLVPLSTSPGERRGAPPEAAGRYSLLIAGRSYEVFVRHLRHAAGSAAAEHGKRTYEIVLNGERFEVTLEDERTRALAAALSSGHDQGEALVRAPMPGLVLALPCPPGTSVTRGTTVAVLEAMKMENDLPSPRNGFIKELRVTPGQTVNQGDVLVVVAGE